MARRPNRWNLLGVAAVAYVVLQVASVVTTNENFAWPMIGRYLFAPPILHGIGLTIWLTVVVMLIGVLLGVPLAIMRISGNPLVSGAAWCYVWVFRGTPLLIQVIFWFNISALFPVIHLSIPFGPSLALGSANSLITPLTAAVIALALNEAAYMAETIRGGLLGVDQGQRDAARALGMTGSGVLRMIMPQAMRMIIPPTANNTITTLKNTALVSVIGIADLLHSAQIIYAQNYQTIPLLIVAALWYLALTSLLGIGQNRLERHFGKGARPMAARGRDGR
ncbi:amino acid ABC transporter permease [Pseudonocardia sp. S2-4]|uniref:Amino acid ABC transporter permease n=1 Tax=Pseudonocardia humida TaxID=2800819 RepID=A0ABT1AAU6_9PSEU|nr:amino acid ABC transporter permease [Pseudonocardia humida]